MKNPFVLSLSKDCPFLGAEAWNKEKTALRQAQGERIFHMQFPCLKGEDWSPEITKMRKRYIATLDVSDFYDIS